MQARLRSIGAYHTISETQTWTPFRHPDDILFFTESYRLAGVLE
jgi:hypothetical protein